MRPVSTSLDSYDLPPAVRAFEEFFDDLSNWYVRLTRRRFWKNRKPAQITRSGVVVDLHLRIGAMGNEQVSHLLTPHSCCWTKTDDYI